MVGKNPVGKNSGKPPEDTLPPEDVPSGGDNDDLDARIQLHLQRTLAQFTGGKSLEEVLGGIVEQAATMAASIAQSRFDQSIAQLQTTIETHVQEIIAQAQSRATAQQQPLSVDGPQPATSPQAPSPSQLGREMLQGLTLDKVNEMVMSWINVFQQSRDPLAAFERLAERRPAMAQFIGQQLAPDPLVNQLPSILAQNSLETTRQIMRTFRGKGGGKGAYNPFLLPDEDIDDGGEAPPEEPTSSIPSPQRPRSATMGKPRSAKELV